MSVCCLLGTCLRNNESCKTMTTGRRGDLKWSVCIWGSAAGFPQTSSYPPLISATQLTLILDCRAAWWGGWARWWWRTMMTTIMILGNFSLPCNHLYSWLSGWMCTFPINAWVKLNTYLVLKRWSLYNNFNVWVWLFLSKVMMMRIKSTMFVGWLAESGLKSAWFHL